MNFKAKKVSLNEIITLRHSELRPKSNESDAIWDGDFDMNTFHFGLYITDQLDVIRNSRPVCCLTFLKRNYVANNDLNDSTSLHASYEGGYQLRGMATDIDYQKLGAGTKLLSFAEKTVINEVKGITYFWCNARVSAIPFYEKNGWETTGQVFMIKIEGEDIPHKRMLKNLI